MIRGIDQATVQQLKDYFCLRIYKMTKALKTARIRVAATACFYFHRFFLKYSFDQHDPRMIAPACIYLSGASLHTCRTTRLKGAWTDIYEHDVASYMQSVAASTLVWIADLLQAIREIVLVELLMLCSQSKRE